MILRGIGGFCGGSVSVSGQARVETKDRGIRSIEPLRKTNPEAANEVTDEV
jgi:hypothetical protein